MGSRLEAGIVEIVAPAEALRLAVAGPAVEAERREVQVASRSSSALVGAAMKSDDSRGQGSAARDEQAAWVMPQQLRDLGRRQLGRELVERALPGPCRAPAQQRRAVAEAAARDLVVADLDHQLVA